MKDRLPNCILFDLDGTLLDSLPGIEDSVREAFAACHVPLFQSSLRELIGPPIATILARAGQVRDSEVLAKLEAAFRARYDAEGWRMTACFPGVEVVLQTLRKAGHRLFVVSNKPRHISLQLLEHVKILDLFETVVTRDSRNPEYSGKEEMIRALMSEHRLTPDECLFAGDTMEDAIAAVALGIKSAYMNYGYGRIDDSHSVPVDFRLDGFTQFLPLMEEEPIHD